MNKDQEKKVTNEKPASFFPLDFTEALAAFLKVKPKSKKEMDKAIKDAEKNKKSSQ